MKKTILILCCILLLGYSSLWAISAGFMGSGSGTISAAGGDCPSQTYIAYWDGTHSSGATYICLANGVSDRSGTQTGGTLSADHGDGEVGYGVTAAAQRISWDNTASDIIDATTALTIYVKFRYDTDGANQNSNLIESKDTGQNNICLFLAGSTDEPRTVYDHGDTLDVQNPTIVNLSRDGITWEIVGFTFDPASAGADDMGLCSANDGDANCTTWEAVDNAIDTPAYVGTDDDVQLGDLDCGYGGDPIDIDKFVILSGYKTALPAWFNDL